MQQYEVSLIWSNPISKEEKTLFLRGKSKMMKSHQLKLLFTPNPVLTVEHLQKNRGKVNRFNAI